MRAAITTHAMSLKRRLAGSCLWGMKCGTFTNGSAMRVFSSADACLLCSGAFCVVAMVARCGAAEVAVVVLTSANGRGAPQNGQKFSPRAGSPLPQVEQNATSLWGLGAAADFRSRFSHGWRLLRQFAHIYRKLAHALRTNHHTTAGSEFCHRQCLLFSAMWASEFHRSERSSFVIQMQRYKNYGNDIQVVPKKMR